MVEVTRRNPEACVMDCFVIQYEFPGEMSSPPLHKSELYLARISFQKVAVFLKYMHILYCRMETHFLPMLDSVGEVMIFK